MDIQKYFDAVVDQKAEEMREFFCENASVSFHNTNERFTVEEFITVNCKYPGKWHGTLDVVVQKGDMFITAAHVYSDDLEMSFHVTSFIRTKEDKIISIDEYWGEDGAAPSWRIDMHIGTPII